MPQFAIVITQGHCKEGCQGKQAAIEYEKIAIQKRYLLYITSN